MRKITDIYKEYNIMPQLAMHQLRVAAVAKQICESLTLDIDTHSVIAACLLHDMANIVKFDLNYTKREFPEFFGDHDFDHWQNIQKEYIEKYGEDDHEATRKLVHNMELSKEVLNLLDQCLDHSLRENIHLFSLPALVCKYADTRLTPHRVMGLRERLEEWQKRDARITIEHMEETYKKFKIVEDFIFSHSKIKPEDITDEYVAETVEHLKNFEI